VKVAVAGTLQDAVTLRIEVTDTGIGISPEAAAGLFQPFAQADGSITRKYGGTGLGLVISRQLAELMGGEMGMTSEVGRGSTFWFTLRVTPVQSAGQVSRRSKGNLEGVSALVVQASDSGRERLCDVLATRQVRVTGESTVEGALRRLEVAAQVGNPFDIVVVDLRSHEISVLDFAAAANDLGLMSRSRVILISGPGLPGDAQRLQQLGAAAYLTSPITNADLFDCFEMVMGSEPAHVSSTSDSAGLITRHTLKEDRFNANPVLLVEDNSVNQKVMVGFLTKLGYRTDVATNGREALEALSRTAYRLVLMDSQMPELDGFATTTEIRRREQNTRHTIVVAVTAHAMKGERERCLAAGMDDYLSKPVSLERLADVMERWLSSPVDGSPESVPRTAQSHLAEEAVPTVDATVLAHLRELEADVPGLLQDVLSTFLRETPVRLAKLAGAISTEDHAAVQAVAHSLKGSAGSIGAQRMLELCTRLEGSGGESLARCGPILEALGDEFRLLRDWLDREHVNPDLLDEATGEIVVHDES
jgi:two-component system sensor histidine kinase/response regulator